MAEIKRERHVTESLQKDNAMLREQLRRSQEVCTKQELHIDALEKENAGLKRENVSLLDDKEALH